MVILFSSTRISKRNSRNFGRGIIPARPATDAEAALHYLETTYTREEKEASEFFSITLPEARTALDLDPHVLDNAIADMEERQACFDRIWREEHEYDGHGAMVSAYAH